MMDQRFQMTPTLAASRLSVFTRSPERVGISEGGDALAAHAHLQKAPGDPEAASARLVADVPVGELAFLLFGDAAHGSLECVLGGGDRPLVASFRVAGAVQDGDDRLLFMNVELEVEFESRACDRFDSL